MNSRLPNVCRRVLPAAPLIAVLTIVLIAASVIGTNRAQVVEAGGRLLLAVLCLHTAGFFFGYVVSRLWLGHAQAARTASIEVGMQNSGLGVILARGNFTNPLVAIPSAIATVAHSLIGSLVAAWWRRSARPEAEL